MTPDMKRLCDVTYKAMEQHRSAEERGDLYKTIVRAVLVELRRVADSGYLSDEVTPLESAADPGRLYPGTEGLDHQMRNLIDHILNGSAVMRNEDGDVLVPSSVSAEVHGATAFISGPAPDASYIVGKPDRSR